MRILHIVTDMGRGGLETMLMNHYRKIDRSKIQFDFLVHRKKRGAYDEEIEALGGKIYRLSRLNPLNKKYLEELDDFFETHKEYMIVHSHLDCMSAIPLKAAKKAGIPIRIAHSHSSNQEKNLKYILKLYYKRKISSYSTHLFACGEDAGKWMFGKNQFHVFHNAINTKQFGYNILTRERIKEELQLEDNIILGHVGNFSVAKNHIFLIDIFKNINIQHSNVKLLLIGGGPEKHLIEKKVNQERLNDKVIFLGVRSDVSELMQAMDVFILPSLYEGLPVTLIEAQTAGLPCIISDKVPIECKITDLVEQVALNKSAEEWAMKVLKKTSYVREDYAERIKLAGYDIEENVLKLEKIYQELYKRALK